MAPRSFSSSIRSTVSRFFCSFQISLIKIPPKSFLSKLIHVGVCAKDAMALLIPILMCLIYVRPCEDSQQAGIGIHKIVPIIRAMCRLYARGSCRRTGYILQTHTLRPVRLAATIQNLRRFADTTT